MEIITLIGRDMKDKDLPKTCCECRQVLTSEEEYYYSEKCEKCGKEYQERLLNWLNGKDDKLLDDKFSTTTKTDETLH